MKPQNYVVGAQIVKLKLTNDPIQKYLQEQQAKINYFNACKTK